MTIRTETREQFQAQMNGMMRFCRERGIKTTAEYLRAVEEEREKQIENEVDNLIQHAGRI